MSTPQQEPYGAHGGDGTVATTDHNSYTAETRENSSAACCNCTTRCELGKCTCVGKQVCITCAPLSANKCENHSSEQYKQGKRVVRSISTGAAAAATSSSAAATAAPAGSPGRRRGRANIADGAAASAALAYADSNTLQQSMPQCVAEVTRLCDAVNNSTAAKAAGVPTLTWDQFHNIEKLLNEYTRLHSEALRHHGKFKETNKTAVQAQAALANKTRECAELTKKYNEVVAKLKSAEANVKNSQRKAISNKRTRDRDSDEQQHSERDAEVTPDSSNRNHISRADDSRRQRTGIIHPDRMNQVLHRAAPSRSSAKPAAAREHIMIPANRCLVASGVGARLHTPTAEVVHIVNQLLVNSGIIRDEDQGDTMSIDVYSMPGSAQPIQWKVVFKSARAAEMVLDRNMRKQNPHITLRAFLDRRQHVEDSDQQQREDRPTAPRGEAVATEQPLTRTLSSDSVVCLAPTQPQMKMAAATVPAVQLKREGGPLQFTTRHAGESQQPAVPVQQPVATPELQQPPQQQLVAVQAAASVCGHSCAAHAPHMRPMPPMMPAYHSGGPAYGPYMQHPRPYYSPPMGYAPGAYVPGPEMYHGFHPQF